MLRTGDALGLFAGPMAGGTNDSLVVYPQGLPLPELGLPAGLPFGARPYQPSDDVRRID